MAIYVLKYMYLNWTKCYLILEKINLCLSEESTKLSKLIHALTHYF